MALATLLRNGSRRKPGLDMSAEEAAHLLGNERRQLVIQFAAELDATEVVDIGEIATAVARQLEYGGNWSDHRKTIYVALYQSHLPRLVDARVLDPVNQDGKYQPGPAAKPLADVIDYLEGVTR